MEREPEAEAASTSVEEIHHDAGFPLMNWPTNGGAIGESDAAKANLLAADLAFNDTHRRIIFQVASAYYRLLNAEGQRQAVTMLKLKEMTLQQAATASGMSVGSLKVATHRGIKALRRILGQGDGQP